MADDKNTRKCLGDLEISRELGRGGMGIVYEARQVSLNRKVALKVISGSLGLSSKAVPCFQREAEAAGKLHHTNIVPIYSTGNEDGAHYYAMELIDGPSLHQVILSLRSGDRKGARVSGSFVFSPRDRADLIRLKLWYVDASDRLVVESSTATRRPFQPAIHRVPRDSLHPSDQGLAHTLHAQGGDLVEA